MAFDKTKYDNDIDFENIFEDDDDDDSVDNESNLEDLDNIKSRNRIPRDAGEDNKNKKIIIACISVTVAVCVISVGFLVINSSKAKKKEQAALQAQQEEYLANNPVKNEDPVKAGAPSLGSDIVKDNK